jgi:hypothetical protein
VEQQQRCRKSFNRRALCNDDPILPSPEHSPTKFYRRILVPVDGSCAPNMDCLLLHLARDLRSGIALARVIKPPELPQNSNSIANPLSPAGS